MKLIHWTVVFAMGPGNKSSRTQLVTSSVMHAPYCFVCRLVVTVVLRL